MIIRSLVKNFASQWETKTGYYVSPDMVSAVTLVIIASDPRGIETDNTVFIEEMTTRILNAALVP